jgi:hypothetical protein
MMTRTTLTVDIEYDPELTDPDGLASAMDRLLETVLSTPGIMDEYANPKVGEFFVANTAGNQPPPDDDSEMRRWVLYDLATDALLTARLYTSYEEAADDASRVNDVLVLPLVCQDIVVRPAPDDSKESGHGQP